MLLWTGKRHADVGVCSIRPGPTPFLASQGLKTLAPPGKGEIGPLIHCEGCEREVPFLAFLSMGNFPNQVTPGETE